MAGQYERVGERNSRSVHHAVAAEALTCIVDKSMTPGADGALTIDDHLGDAVQPVLNDGVVFCSEKIFGQEDVHVGITPRSNSG